jgi:hypothetical protein
MGIGAALVAMRIFVAKKNVTGPERGLSCPQQRTN